MKYKHLPHIDISGYYQFITFRTHDSVDDYVRKLARDNTANSKKQLEVDCYLDDSPKGAYLNGEILMFLHDFFTGKDEVLYKLFAFSIMPNHVHILIQPLNKLADIMQGIKGSSAKTINEMLGKSGIFWAGDYYDKAIRNEKHFFLVYEYIKNNPLKLSKAIASPLRFYGVYEDE